MKKGKIKFANVKNNRGVDTDFFRVVYDVRANNGDWQEMEGFPAENSEMEFYFPFTKMENNIKVVYSGYTNLPARGKGSKEESYFVVSEGIGCPVIAKPAGHNGNFYDGIRDNIILTTEHLKKWSRVKKRMTLFLVPIGWAPNEYLVWHTTGEIAMSQIQSSYSQLVSMLGTDLSLIPLCFRAVGISGKSASGKNYRKFIGSIGVKRGLNGLSEGIAKAMEYRKIFNIAALEEELEKESYFYEEDDSTSYKPAIQDGHKEVLDRTTGEMTIVDENGKTVEVSQNIDYGDFLSGLVNVTQAKKIVSLAIGLERESDILKVQSSAQALVLLNSLQSEKNKAA